MDNDTIGRNKWTEDVETSEGQKCRGSKRDKGMHIRVGVECDKRNWSVMQWRNILTQ